MSDQTIAVVTGAAGGIGAAVALDLVRQGAWVVATDRDAVALQAVADRATAQGKMTAVAGDLLDPELGTTLVNRATEYFGAPTALVNCAGLLLDHRVQKMPLETFRKLIAINLCAPLRLIDAVVPMMKVARHGRIVSLASRAWLGNFGSSGYSAAKGGLVGATRSLALSLAGHGITVNCIAPGFIDTPMARSLPPHIMQRVLEAIPVGRPGHVDDISALTSFLLSDASGYITGQTIVACGGRSLSQPLTRRKETA